MKKIQFRCHDILCPPLLLKIQSEGSEVFLDIEKTSKTLLNMVKRGVIQRPDLQIYDDTGFGDEPVNMRKNTPTVGGSVMSDRMEKDRMFGVEIAKRAGIKVPRTYQFSSFKEIKDFVNKNKGRWVMKQCGELDDIKGLNYVGKMEDGSDMIDYVESLENKWVEGLKPEFVLQEFIDGYEVACSAWWNGKEFIKDKDGDEICDENWEHKSLMAGDMGVSTGEMFTLIKYKKAKDSKLFSETLDKIRDILKESKFIGDVDANTIISEKEVYFLEWTMRFGSPATSGQLAIHKTPWGDFLQALAEGKQIGFEYDPRWTIVCFLYCPPFPNSNGDKITSMIEDKYQKNPPKSIDDKKELLESRLMDAEDTVVRFKEDLSEEEVNNVHLEYVYSKGGKILLANPTGYVLTITGQGNTPKEAGGKTEKLLKKMMVAKGFWRNDFTSHYDRCKEDLMKWGFLEKEGLIPEAKVDISKLIPRKKQLFVKQK